MMRPNTIHENLLGQSIEWAETDFLSALRNGATTPVVLVLDLDDESARAIAGTTGRAAELEALIERTRRVGCSALATWGLPHDMAASLLAEEFPDVAGDIATTCAGGRFWVVVVAAGAASVFTMPVVEE
jgi:hypothetical protein